MESHKQTITRETALQQESLPEVFWKNLNNAVDALSKQPIFCVIRIFVGTKEELEPKKLKDLIDAISSKGFDYEILLIVHDKESLVAWCDKNAISIEKIRENKIVDTLSLRIATDWLEDHESYRRYLNNSKDKSALTKMLGKEKDEDINRVVDFINRMRVHPNQAFVSFDNSTLSEYEQDFKKNWQKDKILNLSNSTFFHIKFKLIPMGQLQDYSKKIPPKRKGNLKESDGSSQSGSPREILPNQEYISFNSNQFPQVPLLFLPGYPMPMLHHPYMYGHETNAAPVLVKYGDGSQQMVAMLPQVSGPVLSSQSPFQETRSLVESLPALKLTQSSVTSRQEISPGRQSQTTVIAEEKEPSKKTSPRDELVLKAIDSIVGAGGSSEYVADFFNRVTEAKPENINIANPNYQASNYQYNNSDQYALPDYLNSQPNYGNVQNNQIQAQNAYGKRDGFQSSVSKNYSYNPQQNNYEKDRFFPEQSNTKMNAQINQNVTISESDNKKKRGSKHG